MKSPVTLQMGVGHPAWLSGRVRKGSTASAQLSPAVIPLDLLAQKKGWS